jgi:hypothetical protein
VGEGLGDHRGGILGLLRLLDAHGEAIRSDLFRAGRSLDDLGSPGFSWLDLRAFLTWSPASSAFIRSFHGDDVAAWADPAVPLLAAVVDLLAAANWQRGNGRGSKPKPIKRPGTAQRVGGRTVMELDELDQFLGWSPRT